MSTAKKQKRQQNKLDPVWVQRKKEQKQSRWQKAKGILLSVIPVVLRFFGIPLPQLKMSFKQDNIFSQNNENDTPMQFNQTNGITGLVVETIVRFFTKSPRYFNVLKVIVIATGGALALVNYVIDPNTAIDLSPQLHDTIEQVIKVLVPVLITLQLAVKEKSTPAKK